MPSMRAHEEKAQALPCKRKRPLIYIRGRHPYGIISRWLLHRDVHTAVTGFWLIVWGFDPQHVFTEEGNNHFVRWNA